LAVVIITCAAHAQTQAPAPSPSTPPAAGKSKKPKIKTPLRYKLKKGDHFRYSVKIIIGPEKQLLEENSETRSASVSFGVFEAGDDGFTLVCEGLKQIKISRPNDPATQLSFLSRWTKDQATNATFLYDAVGRNRSDGSNRLYTPTVGDPATCLFGPHPNATSLFSTRRDAFVYYGDPKDFKSRDPQNISPYNAVQSILYDLKTFGDKTAQVDFKYRLSFAEPIQSLPRIEITGAGTTEFDMKKGIPISGDLRGKATVHLKEPVTWYFSRRFKLQETRQGVVIGSKLSAQVIKRVRALDVPAAQRKPLSAGGFSTALIQLGSVNVVEREKGIEALARAKPVIAQRVHVLTALKALTRDTESQFVRLGAAKAMAIWAQSPARSTSTANRKIDRAQMLKLIRQLTRAKSNTERRDAIRQLAEFPDPAAANALASALESVNRRDAARSLEKLGPVAGDAVAGKLKSENPSVVISVCRILERIGSSKHLPALQKLSAASKSPLIKTTADNAIRAIRQRK